MGWGDEIMAAGCAEAKARELGGPVVIVDRNGVPRWSDIWKNHPDILRPEDAKRASGSIRNGPWARPYIARWARWGGRACCVFTQWRARDFRGRIFLSGSEQSIAAARYGGIGYRKFVVIEPRVDPAGNPNKQWPLGRYAAVLDALPDVVFVQLGPENVPALNGGVRRLMTSTFREACAILEGAAAYLGPEGGLHHAAAALGIPAVVIFGGHTSPETTGYPGHTNLYVESELSPCGRWEPCPHCREAMESISVESVVDALKGVLHASRAA